MPTIDPSEIVDDSYHNPSSNRRCRILQFHQLPDQKIIPTSIFHSRSNSLEKNSLFFAFETALFTVSVIWLYVEHLNSGTVYLLPGVSSCFRFLSMLACLRVVTKGQEIKRKYSDALTSRGDTRYDSFYSFVSEMVFILIPFFILRVPFKKILVWLLACSAYFGALVVAIAYHENDDNLAYTTDQGDDPTQSVYARCILAFMGFGFMRLSGRL
jgi:hypothetical protein